MVYTSLKTTTTDDSSKGREDTTTKATALVKQTSMERTKPIERFIIVHLTLPQLSTGKVLNESASDSELAEEILYYWSHTAEGRLHDNSLGDLSHQTEAIRFAGLCSALFKLPSSLDPKGDKLDYTKEIYLEKCFLVFVKLESSPDILAVAQISRRDTDCYGATPSAARKAIESCHTSFELFRGGRIHRRLRCTQDDKSSRNTVMYGEMKTLYGLREKLRHIIDRNASASREQSDLQQRIDLLLCNLPICYVREDLRLHYDAFISETNHMASESPGVFRCIVESFPTPFLTPENTESPTATSAYSVFPSQSILTLSSSLLGKSVRDNRTLLGLSAFVRGQLITTNFSHDVHYSIPVDLSIALMSHMEAYRFKMKFARHTASATGSSTPSRTFSNLKPLALSLGTEFNDSPWTAPIDGHPSFLAPPPLALLSAADERQSFTGPEDSTKVWLPLVSVEIKENEDTWVDLRIALYTVDDYSFIFFFKRPEDQEGDEETPSDYYSSDLKRIDEVVQSWLGQHHTETPHIEVGEEADEEGWVDTRGWYQLGQDVIVADRRKHTIGVHLHSQQMHIPYKSQRQISGLKGIFGRQRSTSYGVSQTNDSQKLFADLPDGRHQLSCQLSLDSLLALEDLINCARTKHLELRKPFEICTFLPQKWVYAYIEENTELYVLLDTSIFITIGDVQSAVDRIKSELIEDDLLDSDQTTITVR